jgi:hypothetical protein
VIQDRIEDGAVVAKCAQFLRLGRKAEKGVGLAGGEHVQRASLCAGHPFDVSLRIEAHVGRHD